MTKRVSKLHIAGTVLLGLATITSFFYQHNGDFWALMNVGRVLLILAFLILLFTVIKGLPPRDSHEPNYARTLIWLLPSLAIIFALINAFAPDLGHSLVKGGDWVSFRPAIYVKMAFDVVSCVLFILLAKQFFGRKQWLLFGTFTLLALITFWMAMEEISWGQRIFKWETTAYFAENNMQGETNLHNLNTQLFQNVLYFGGFLLLVAMPFFRDHLTKLLQKIAFLKPLVFLLPGAWMTLAFAASMGFLDPYMSEAGWRWGPILFQTIATGVILAVFAWRAYKRSDVRLQDALRSLVAFAAVLVLSLVYRGLWDHDSGSPTEYIELFIAFGITAWALELKARARRQVT
ncbi:MAG: hypothetical protein ACM3JF_00395 [Sphaerimonospora mesophila]